MIYTLGKEYLGLNSIFSSILTVLNLGELGVGSAFVYFLYRPIANNDLDEIGRLLAFYKKVYRIIGISIFGIGLGLTPFLNLIVSKECPSDINIYVIYLITLLQTCASYWLFAYKRVLLIGNQRMDIESKVAIVANAFTYTLQILLLLFSKNYYYFIITNLIYVLLENCSIGYITKQIYPNVKCSGTITSETKRGLYTRVGALVGHKVGATVISSADSMVISAFLGLTEVAIYSNYFYIMRAIVSIMSMIISSLTAGIGNKLIKDCKEENYSFFYTINFIIMWFVSFCTICFFCLFQPFMTWWMGEDMLLPFSSVIFLVIYYFTWQIRVGVTMFKDASGLWKADALKPYISSIVNIALNITLVKIIGINGVFISTIVCMLFINWPWEVSVLFKFQFKESAKNYYRSQIKFVFACAFGCALSYAICSLIMVTGILEILIKIAICLLVGNVSILMFTHRSEEYSMAKKLIFNALYRFISK